MERLGVLHRENDEFSPFGKQNGSASIGYYPVVALLFVVNKR